MQGSDAVMGLGGEGRWGMGEMAETRAHVCVRVCRARMAIRLL